jgi:hypothetical protein
MANNTATYRVQRALTEPEMTTITAEIDAARDTGGILAAVVRTVFGALLATIGESLASYGPGHKLDPRQFAIPATQWTAISEACTNRASAFGARVTIALELVNVMPSSYDDPSAVIPSRPTVDHRPYEHVLTVSREATDVIAACTRHCDALARHFGEHSREHRDAASSWQRNLALLFSMDFGAATSVRRDGDLSLLVSCGSGFTYGIIFHPLPRRCTRANCTAVISDDGTAWTCRRDDLACEDGAHVPAYPLDAPAPGSWSFHS